VGCGAAGKALRISPYPFDDARERFVFQRSQYLEIVIKRGLGRDDFKVDPRRLRKMLIVHGYTELPVTAEHAFTVETLPLLHKDPFDRLLLAQACAEGMMLLTVDASLLQYQEFVLAV
jgi:PIN domain nuclease of toxin-antitoxin system